MLICVELSDPVIICGFWLLLNCGIGWTEHRLCYLKAFLDHEPLCLGVILHDITHRLIARETCDFVLVAIKVELPKFVYPDKIEGVA